MKTDYWQALSPKTQRWAVIIMLILVVVSLVVIFSPTEPPAHQQRPKRVGIRHIFTDRNPSELGLDSLSADVKEMAQQQALLTKTLTELQQSLGVSAEKLQEVPPEMTAKLQQLEQQLHQLKNAKETPVASDQAFPEELLPTELIFQKQTLKPLNAEASTTYNTPAPRSKIFTHTAKKVDSATTQVEKPLKTPSLPAGSILTGVLLTGMDAPTGQAARREPFPALVRVQLDAQLPNRFRSDVRECFLLVSGYGDLSSERAYLRGETLSCICEDGRTIEEPLDAFAIGEDGKAGIRGRLVSKQGQAISRSMMAGFLGGMSQAFDTHPVPSLNLMSGMGSKTQQYQSIFSKDLLQGSAVKGAGQALDRVAKFYLEMAENLYPVIEIDAGKRIDIIVKKGSKF